jgi:hypothetical protein
LPGGQGDYRKQFARILCKRPSQYQSFAIGLKVCESSAAMLEALVTILCRVQQTRRLADANFRENRAI